MLSKKILPWGCAAFYVGREHSAVLLEAWAGVGYHDASERTVKYIGRVTSPCQWTGIIKANHILVSGWFQAQSHHAAILSSQ